MKQARLIDIGIHIIFAISRKLTNHSLLRTNMYHAAPITNKPMNS